MHACTRRVTGAHLSEEELAAQLKFARCAGPGRHRPNGGPPGRDGYPRHSTSGPGSPRLYHYCLKVLHLSEWEAWNRIEAGHVARRFPILLDMLEEGSIHITGIKLLGPHLTPENHRAVANGTTGVRSGVCGTRVPQLTSIAG